MSAKKWIPASQDRTPERLNTVFTLPRRGRTATLPPWAMLRHIVNHSTYRRGRVAAKLKRFGVEQPATDFFFRCSRRRPFYWLPNYDRQQAAAAELGRSARRLLWSLFLGDFGDA